MIIRNCYLKEKLRGSRFMEADTGEGGAVYNSDTESAKSGTDNKETIEKYHKELKSYTQDELDKLIGSRVSRERKKIMNDEGYKDYEEWKENRKKNSDKQSEAIANAEKLRGMAEEKVSNLEAKVACLSRGVNTNSVDDVVILAKSLIGDEITIDKAIDKVLEKYPIFMSEYQKVEKRGFRIGSGGGENQKDKANNALQEYLEIIIKILEPIDVGTDDNGVYERVVELNLY